AVVLRADVGSASDTSHATGTAVGFAGRTNATANNSVSTHAKVEVQSDGNDADVVHVTTAQLNVVAQGASPNLVTDAERHISALDVGSSREDQEQPTRERLIDFNADVTILGAGVRLHIGPQGQVLEQTGGVPFHTSGAGTELAVDPITNSTSGLASLSAAGAGTPAISGTARFHFDGALSSVKVTNDSAANLVMSDVHAVNPNPQPNLHVSATDTSQFHAVTDLTSNGGTLVKVTNTRASDVRLGGVIDNALGSTTVTNSGGDILSGGSGEQIKTGQLKLSSLEGTIGTAANRLRAQMVESALVAPVLSVTSTGNAYLNLSALNLTNNALTVTGTSLAAPVIDLRIQDGQQRTTATGPLTEQASSYNFGGVSAGTELDADAGGSTAVNLSFTSPGDVPVGSVTSRLGDVRLTAAGAIRAARPGGAPDV